MIKKKIIINNFESYNGNLFITDKNNRKYFFKVNDGNVETEIFNTDNVLVGLKYLDKNDVIKIYGYESKSNNFIIKKILVNTKYEFNSESSEDLDFYQ